MAIQTANNSNPATVGAGAGNIREVTIIVAAGSGTRFGSDVPKQFLPLEGLPVVCHSVRAFSDTFPDGAVIVVLPAADFDHWRGVVAEACERAGIRLPLFAKGGATRWESVKNGLSAIPEGVAAGAAVLVHDGARPLIPVDVINRVRSATRNTDAAIPAIEVTDSLRRLEDGTGPMSEPVNRAEYRAVQTPQGASLWRMREAYSLPYSDAFTDDASVLAEAGFVNQVLVKGSPENIKITNPFDLEVARLLLSRRG